MSAPGDPPQSSSAAPESAAGFARAVLFGAGAALFGFIIYSIISVTTGWHIGALALAIAWCICKAMKKGAKGRGGRKYQVLAALFTYSAVSLSAIPEAIVYWTQQAQVTAPDTQPPERARKPATVTQQPKRVPAVIGDVVLMGLASPFLALRGSDPWKAGIGLLLILLSVAYAWIAMAPSMPVVEPAPRPS